MTSMLLHRINGYDAAVALDRALADAGDPARTGFTLLVLGTLASRGVYLGVEDLQHTTTEGGTSNG